MSLASAAVLWGISPDDLAEALETPVSGECFPLSGRCGRPTGSPDRRCCDIHEAAEGGA